LIDSVRYRWEFALLRQRGQYRRSGPLGVRVVLDDELPGARFAYAIGTHVGHAVRRNRIRRQLRSIVQQLDTEMRVNPGRYLIIVSPKALSLTFDDLRAHVSQLVGSR